MIEIEHLTKRYGAQDAVRDVSFTCAPGTVTGFLGPNGAGKSTTMRMLCGLTRPTSGTTRVLGRPYRELPVPGREVGVLLDASAQHAGRRGREVLVLTALSVGLDAADADRWLTRVGLDERAGHKRVRDYSLGMRQRLGLAAAMVGDPSVLVLDEPANGLDPEGIHWMRGLLRDFADGGGTVLLSSHLLHEVEAVADRLVIIRAGEVVAEGARSELLAGSGTVVAAGDADALLSAMRDAGLTAHPAPDGSLRVEADPEQVGAAALRGGVALRELRTADGAGLERLFLELTGTPQAPAGDAVPEPEAVR